MMNLLIVESPAKAKTIAGYLRARPEAWRVEATGGHLEDLPKNRMGLRQQGARIQPEWELIHGKGKIVARIAEAAQQADEIYVGADDDREGERICHDVVRRAGIARYHRITFAEVTASAINAAIDVGERGMHGARVGAQMTRRVIDRQIGYPMSGLIAWHFRQQRKPERPNGVGRVISPALHILEMAEQKISAFVPEAYSKVAVDYRHAGIQFRLIHPTKFQADEEALGQLYHKLQKGRHLVYNYQRKTRDVAPFPPLTTARLQRCAFYLFGFSPEHTMRLAQQLYEGVDLEGGRQGLITYPRTDSMRLSDQATAEIIALLSEVHEQQMVVQHPRVWTNPERAQAAHEAIRPVSVQRQFWPTNLRDQLSEDQTKLYEMIFYRTLATQMADSVYDVSEIEIDVDGDRLSGHANELIFDGWERLDGHRADVSERQKDDERHNADQYAKREVRLPEVGIGEEIRPIDVLTIELSTKAPPRYGVGRFVTTLDNRGIGRPSTLDGIVRALVSKGYVSIRQGMLYVTPNGRAVDEWTSEHAAWLNDVEQAAAFERQLDRVEAGEIRGQNLVAEYMREIEALRERLGYQAWEDTKPSDAQRRLIRQIAGEQGIQVPEAALQSARGAREFLDRHTVNRKKAGKCPACGGRILAHPKVFSCQNRDCDMKVWRSSVEHFIAHFGLPHDAGQLIEELLKRKRTKIEGLRGKQGKFDALLALEREPEFDAWRIAITGFPRRAKPANPAQPEQRV